MNPTYKYLRLIPSAQTIDKILAQGAPLAAYDPYAREIEREEEFKRLYYAVKSGSIRSIVSALAKNQRGDT